MNKRIKKELETLGERTGERIGQAISKDGEAKAARVGKRLGESVGEHMERVHERLEKETVTKQEQLGVGGKLGTALGVLGKNLVEKRYGILGKLAGGGNLVSDGRILGAKAEKMVKRAVRSGVERLGKRSDDAEKTVSNKNPKKDNV
jgi:hypothetical protein